MRSRLPSILAAATAFAVFFESAHASMRGAWWRRRRRRWRWRWRRRRRWRWRWRWQLFAAVGGGGGEPFAAIGWRRRRASRPSAAVAAASRGHPAVAAVPRAVRRGGNVSRPSRWQCLARLRAVAQSRVLPAAALRGPRSGPPRRRSRASPSPSQRASRWRRSSRRCGSPAVATASRNFRRAIAPAAADRARGGGRIGPAAADRPGEPATARIVLRSFPRTTRRGRASRIDRPAAPSPAPARARATSAISSASPAAPRRGGCARRRARPIVLRNCPRERPAPASVPAPANARARPRSAPNWGERSQGRNEQWNQRVDSRNDAWNQRADNRAAGAQRFPAEPGPALEQPR